MWMELYVDAVVWRIQMMFLIPKVKCTPPLNSNGQSLRNSVK